ncbi:MAG TPA: glycosyltransferase family 2 protein, partial [Actinomycetota bacterium]|nr:glycosyltransferase family 2 protein [Actinomycetota bacterium]
SGVSTFDMLLLGLQIKYLLLVQALRLPVPPAEKLPVAATALGNLFRANLRQPFDHRRELRHLERQAAGLRRTAAERSRLLSSLRGVVAERRAAAGSTGEQMDDGSAAPPAPAAPEPRSRLTDYFSPPTPEQSGYYLALSRHVEGLRRHVEEQARRIEKLHSEAASLQEALEAGGRAGASDPLVSVGIPVYNGASHLAAAIDSVLGQDYCNLEVVLVDNASTDGTEAICRRYAEADPRVRYLRNGTNIGFLPNFRRALDESRGRYFTWLAHDDFLSDPSYLGTVVRYLEDHPDTVCCHTAINLLDNELKGSVEVMAFPEIAPERRWPKARRALFRWPHGWLDSVIYGVFRRSEIARIPFPEWTYRGRPHIFCWEMDVLTSLSAAGRIVALPECLRAYRLSEVSVGKQIGESVSSFDLLLLGLRMKLILLRRAATQPAGRIERAGLLATAVGNLFRANFRQPYDHRTVLQERENELRMLQKTAAERSRLIRFLRSEIAARKEIVASKGTPVEPDGEPSAGPAEDFPEPAAPDRSLYGRLTAFFRPLSAGQVRRLYELSEQIGRLREVCAGQEKEIERLSAEAAHWLEVMHQGAASRRA